VHYRAYCTIYRPLYAGLNRPSSGLRLCFDIADAHVRPRRSRSIRLGSILATWRSGYAAACKAVYTGSTPVVALEGARPDRGCCIFARWVGGGSAQFNITALTVPNGLGAAAGGPTVTLNPGMPHEDVLTQATPSECDPFPLVVPEYSWWADWDAEHKEADISQEAFEYQFALTGGSGAEIGSVEFTDVPFDKGNAEGKRTRRSRSCTRPGRSAACNRRGRWFYCGHPRLSFTRVRV
jgi:hypothetical protein